MTEFSKHTAQFVSLETLAAAWERITTLVAELCHVQACLVMRGNPDSMEVMARSATANNPYHVGETAPRTHELYCETVIANQTPLEVPSAQDDPVWRDNPDTQLGMVSYYGVPVNWPSGESFGTFCILDDCSKHTTETERRLVRQFADVIEDHLRLIALTRQLEHEATHDPLLGVYNRRMFFELLERKLAEARRTDRYPAVIEFDVDHFKLVNDTLGHAHGDAVLRAIVAAVSAALREADVLARIGGEEFAVIADVQGPDDMKRVAERIRSSVERSEDVEQAADRTVTISCGAAQAVADDDPASVLFRADAAMYEAKNRGRNCAVICACDDVLERVADRDSRA